MASPFGKLGRQLGNLGDRLAAKSASLRRGSRAGDDDDSGTGEIGRAHV